MNLEKLFQMQKELDDRILAEHPIQEGEDRLAKKILALLVELGELAQEWRGFKFWSKDQEPRFGGYCGCDDGYVDIYLGHGEVGQKLCPQCEGEGTLPNRVLEEYVDCLHFILSIGNDIIGELTDSEIEDILLNAKEDSGDVVETFIVLNSCSCELKFREKYDYISLLTIFLSLGLTLGFTWDQVEEAYMRKNAVNHHRQVNGY